MQIALTFSSGIRIGNHLKVQFWATLGEEPEVELALVYRFCTWLVRRTGRKAGVIGSWRVFSLSLGLFVSIHAPALGGLR